MRERLGRLLAHRVTRNTSALALLQVVSYVAAFLVLIHLTSILGVATYGVVAFSIGITQVLAILLDVGLTLASVEKLSAHRNHRRFVARLAGAIYALKLVAFLAGAVVVVGYAALTEAYAAHRWLFVLSLLPLLGQALQPIWFFLGIERMRYVTAFMVLAKLSFVVLVRLTVKSAEHYLWVPISDGIAQLCAAIVGIALLYRIGYTIALPSRRYLKYAARMTSGFFASRVAATASSYSGVLILGLLSNPAAVAVYSLAEQLYRAMHALFSPLVQALYPFMAKERDFVLLRRVALGCTVVAVTGAVVGHLLAPPLIARLIGPDWGGALPVVDLFLVAIGLHVLGMLAGYPLAAALGRLDVANRSVIGAAVLYLAIAFVLYTTKMLTPTGLAWAMVFSESYILGYCLISLGPSARRSHAQQLAQLRS